MFEPRGNSGHSAILWPRSDENGVFMRGCLDVQIPCVINRSRVFVPKRVPNLVNKSQTIQRIELKSCSVVTVFEGLYLTTDMHFILVHVTNPRKMKDLDLMKCSNLSNYYQLLSISCCTTSFGSKIYDNGSLKEASCPPTMADALASLGQGSSNANVAKIAIEQRILGR